MGRANRLDDEVAYAVRSTLDPSVWSPVIPGTDLATSYDHAGRVRDVKRWLESDAAAHAGAYEGRELRWVHETPDAGPDTWVLYTLLPEGDG